jgi:hypothetical protein
MADPLPIKPPLYVVRITGVAANGAPVLGTGFIVSAQGHVVTCRHVVYPTTDGKPATQLRVNLPYPAEHPCSYQVATTSSEDLAVLESTVPLQSPMPEPLLHECWTRDTGIGDAVSVWGYSAAEHYTHAQQFPCVISGLSDAHGRIGLAGSVNPGDSGGPVLDGKRRVIGIAQAKDAKREGQAMAIPVSLLRPLLREVGVGAGPVDLDDQVVFQAPAPPDYALVGRDALLQELKGTLSTGRHVALCFTPGVGKSALATALANDRDMRARFDSGVLWASLNLKPNVLSELKKWGAAIGLPPQKMEELDKLAPDPAATPEEAGQQAMELWATAISRQIGQRRMLLVVDDAWDLEPARTLLLQAPNCAHLVTTREQGKVAGMLGAGFEVHVVDELSEDDGVEFLRQLAPNAVAMFPDEARAVFQAVGGLPQGLLLLGMHLRQASWANQRRRIADAFRDIQERFKERTEPLQRAIRISYDALPDDASRRALQALAVFRPKPGKFSMDAAAAVLDGPASLVYALHDAGLVETANSGDDPHDLPYTMHRTIAEFARAELSADQAQALHRRAMQHFSQWLKQYEQQEHDPGRYGYQYRYENAQWQDAMDDFLYHLARSGDPASAIVDFGSIYFSAFWWWGCYADFPFCTRLLQQASTKRLSDEARRAFDLLAAFDAAYPKETQRKTGDDWDGVRKVLSELRALGGLDGELRGSESPVVRQTRALTDIFLAEACRFGNRDHAQAERLYRDALALFPDSDWSRPWAMYHLADMLLETGRHEEASRLGANCLALAEAVELKDRDNEVIANAYRLRAQAAEHLGEREEVLDSLQRMVLHAYVFQAVPAPPDAYTVAFYRQITGQAAAILQALQRIEPARALAYCESLRAYWSSYRKVAELEERADAPAELEPMLAAAQPDALCAWLFPEPPPADAMHQRGTRYFNEAITLHNEKLGPRARA